MKIKNPDYQKLVEEIFHHSPFIQVLGLRLKGLEPGWCLTKMLIVTQHHQQDGFVHAGVLAAMADHSAGGAAATLIGADENVLSVEFKINLLRPAQGEYLECRAQVLKPGRRFIIVESEIYADNAKMVSKATVTLAVVPKQKYQ